MSIIHFAEVAALEFAPEGRSAVLFLRPDSVSVAVETRPGEVLQIDPQYQHDRVLVDQLDVLLDCRYSLGFPFMKLT